MIAKSKIVIAFLLLPMLFSCVPFAGDYSEFSNNKNILEKENGYVTDKVYAQGTYTGTIKNGFPDGKGVFKFSNGTLYEGQFKQGKFNGLGEMYFKDGRAVIGTFYQDKESNVTLTRKDGVIFRGKVERGMPTGNGVLTLTDNSTVTGKLDGFSTKGLALLADTNGKAKYAGSFKDLKPHGEGFCEGKPCDMQNGQNVSADKDKQRAQVAARKDVNTEIDERLNKENSQFKSAIAKITKERESEINRLDGLEGPKSGEPCYCYVGIPRCLIVKSNDDQPQPPDGLTHAQREAWWARERARKKEEERVQELKTKELRLQCAHRYADFMGLKQDPNYYQKLQTVRAEVANATSRLDASKRALEQTNASINRELEAERKQRLADQVEMQRRQQAHLEQMQRAREQQKEKLKGQCSAEKFRSANPCKCTVALGGSLKDMKGSACEA